MLNVSTAQNTSMARNTVDKEKNIDTNLASESHFVLFHSDQSRFTAPVSHFVSKYKCPSIWIQCSSLIFSKNNIAATVILVQCVYVYLRCLELFNDGHQHKVSTEPPALHQALHAGFLFVIFAGPLP